MRSFAAAILLILPCLASPGRAGILPTDLESRITANYGPADADERAIWQGLELLEEIIRHSPQRLDAPDLDAYTRGVVERLIGRPAPELRIYVMRDASFNAAMFPTGMMIVNTGLLARAHDEAQFAAVLGHEAGHYFRRHSLDRYRDIRRRSAQMQLAAAAAHANGNVFAPGTESWAAINKAIALSVFRFSRDQESEADAYGIMLMARAGYPPRAASAICAQIIAERRASAAARGKRYLDGSGSAQSTHPATERRVDDLADTATHLAPGTAPPGRAVPDAWDAVMRPYQAMLLREQINLNDPGASLYLLEGLAKGGWTGLLRFGEGEVYRLRDAGGDAAKAAAAYAIATTLPDAPPEAWRAQGFSLLKTGSRTGAITALNRYLSMKPDAADAAMIRFSLAVADEGAVAGGRLSVDPAPPWTRLPAHLSATRWEALWTRNGQQRDRLTLVDGLPDGRAIALQERNADQQVPVFRADMTALDLASMIETSYRVNGVSAFDVESAAPVEFLGGHGIEWRYAYASGIGFRKKGRCVVRVIDNRLYAMKLDGVADREFDAVAADFDRLVAGAQLRR